MMRERIADCVEPLKRDASCFSSEVSVRYQWSRTGGPAAVSQPTSLAICTMLDFTIVTKVGRGGPKPPSPKNQEVLKQLHC